MSRAKDFPNPNLFVFHGFVVTTCGGCLIAAGMPRLALSEPKGSRSRWDAWWRFFGAIGGSVGLVYAAGDPVLAGHYRVMGVPVPSVDSTVLISSAWEFLFQGTLLALQRAIQSELSLPSVVALAILVTVTMLGRPWLKRTIGRWPLPRIARIIGRRGPGVALAAAIVLVAGLESVHVYVRFLVPAGAVVSLLSGERAASPFEQIKEPWNESGTRTSTSFAMPSSATALSVVSVCCAGCIRPTFSVCYSSWLRRAGYG